MTLEGRKIRFSISEEGEVISFYNKETRHEYVHSPGHLWKLIYARGERQEIPVFSKGQHFAVDAESSDSKALSIVYASLVSDEGVLAILLRLTFSVSDAGLSVISSLTCDESDITIMELSITAASGIRSLSGCPEKDALALPINLGKRIANPAYSDLSEFMGFRKYERHDNIHTDIDLLYPRASMQWYDLYNEEEGLYIGSHDEAAPTTDLHIERDVKSATLSMGILRYPFIGKGQTWTSKPIAYAVHRGDWHAGSRIYRSWIEAACWSPPENPDWIRRWKGWLRVILKQHHGEINWNYSDIPVLFDEAQSAGFDTIFLLGWERGGFARLWPDYILDEGMGGEKGLREAIDYVHRKGGRVVMFLSYYLIDRASEFYRSQGGEKITMKSCWGQEIPFPETYCGEGTWRKIANPPMPMYAACPSCGEWQEKMIISARYLTDLGADGVLFDIGAANPYFCFDERHRHEKPSEASTYKAGNYRELRDSIRRAGNDRAIFMEDNVDIYAQSMDVTHSAPLTSDNDQLVEMYRYTFPEAIVTDREFHEDEDDHRRKMNFSFIYGLRLDMTIFRCCGTLSDVPLAASYAKRINSLRDAFSEYLLFGQFIDCEGFSIDSPMIRAKSYRAKNGGIAVAAWNTSLHPVDFTLRDAAGAGQACSLGGDEVAVYVLGKTADTRRADGKNPMGDHI